MNVDLDALHVIKRNDKANMEELPRYATCVDYV